MAMAPAWIIGLRGIPESGVQADGVEGISRGLHAHIRLHERWGEPLQCQPLHEGFGDGLDRERLVHPPPTA